jgi:plasmid stabilization system protein ParE
MICALRFLPELEEDVFAGYSWYEEKAPGLGEEFLRMFYACSAELRRDALIYRKVHGEIRRRLLRRFPYAIYYKIAGNEIIVFGFFHCARDPRTVKAELSDRAIQEDLRKQ